MWLPRSMVAVAQSLLLERSGWEGGCFTQSHWPGMGNRGWWWSPVGDWTKWRGAVGDWQCQCVMQGGATAPP